MSNFYCQQKCGHVDFSIEEWNKAYNEIMDMPISEAEKRKLIDGEPCKEQCFDCIAIVGKTRLKNKRKEEGKEETKTSSEWTKFNMNNCVMVKPNEKGKESFIKNWLICRTREEAEQMFYQKLDKEGFMTLQLWSAFEYFGDGMCPGEGTLHADEFYLETKHLTVSLPESPSTVKEETQEELGFLLHLIDVVACFAMEQNMYYSTEVRKELIQKAKSSFNGVGGKA